MENENYKNSIRSETMPPALLMTLRERERERERAKHVQQSYMYHTSRAAPKTQALRVKLQGHDHRFSGIFFILYNA
jgi:hypothetical protein